ncbi:hypothetical protein MTO96_006355 [Rhipicephalus appendiculatus]
MSGSEDRNQALEPVETRLRQEENTPLGSEGITATAATHCPVTDTHSDPLLAISDTLAPGPSEVHDLDWIEAGERPRGRWRFRLQPSLMAEWLSDTDTDEEVDSAVFYGGSLDDCDDPQGATGAEAAQICLENAASADGNSSLGLRFIYAAFVGWRIHYALASVFEKIALSERITMENDSSALRASYKEYRRCVLLQYASTLDKVLSLPLQAEHTFENDNKDVFAALTILPPDLPVETTAMSTTLTGQQLYYVYYGLGRCAWMRSEHLRSTIEDRFFSPPRYRLNLPLRNSQHFRRAWKCGPPSCLLPADYRP